MTPRFHSAIVLCLLALYVGSTDAEAAFGFRKLLTIDNARVSGTSDLVNFPVLVSLQNDTNLQVNVASAQGFDIEFRAADGRTILNHEIESYDAGTGTLVAWVKVPILDFDADTSIYIYYGDSGVTCALENPDGVWDAAYEAVWHLKESGTGVAGEYKDSTSNLRHGTRGRVGAGPFPTQAATKIGNGQDFTASDTNNGAYLDVGTWSVSGDAISLETWVNFKAFFPGNPGILISRRETVGYGGWDIRELNFGGSERAFHNLRTAGGTDYSTGGSSPALSTSTWYHFFGTYDGATLRIYLNGVQVDSQPATGNLAVGAGAAVLGKDGFFDNSFLNAFLDEARVSSTARSAAWIQTQYNNHNEPTKDGACLNTGFVCVGVQQALPAAQWTNVSVASGLNTGGDKDGGLAWGDFNGDGCLDVLVNTLDVAIDSRLYMQDTTAGNCDGTFTDVSACLAPGLATNTLDRTTLWGDLNNDGNPDFVRNVGGFGGPLEIYLNNGPGGLGGACGASTTWSMFGSGGNPSQTITTSPWGFDTEGLGLVDFDNDGVLDLIAIDNMATIMFENADGTGANLQPINPTNAGLPTTSLGSKDYLAVADLDVDGDVDILARGATGDVDTWMNTGGSYMAGSFDENASNADKGGVAFCDFDDDGDFDLFWTNNGTNQAWRNNGGTDAAVTWTAMGALPAGTGIDGVACGDIDNDGDLDLVLTSWTNDYLFRNDGGFSFVDITPASFGTTDGEASAFADYDRDGDVDLLINQDTANELWRNETNDNNYLVVRALQDVGGGITRDAIGATVQLMDCSLNPVIGVREINGGRGHGSQDPAYLHLGLPSCGATHGPNAVYVVQASFLDGSVVQKAVRPSNILDYQLLNITSTDADDILICSTAVDLVSFDAEARDGAVELTWETGSELDNLGFHVYRSTSAEGPFEPITSTLIPGLGSSPEGARYSFTDSGLLNETTYFYRLEDVETTGRTVLHGPVSATPRAGLDQAPEAAEDELPAEISFGDSTAPDVHLVRQSPRGIVVELVTEGFEAVPQKDGSVRFEIPGLDNDESELALPVKRYWMDVPPGAEAEIVSIKASRVSRFSSLRPAEWDDPELFMTGQGTVQERRRRKARRSRDAGLSPTEAARVASVAYQGDRKKLLLEFSPLRWNATTNELWFARKVQVRLRFKRVSTRRARTPDARHILAQLSTTKKGLHAVSFEDVFGVRRRGLRTSKLRLSRQGETEAFHVTPNSNRFGPGSTLYFVSAGGDANPYGKEAVYELEYGVRGEQMPVESAPPSGESTTFYWEELEREEDNLYQAALLDAQDPWLWDLVMASQTKRYPFVVSALADVGRAARLIVRLQGGSDLPTNPDHHVRVFINDVAVGDVRWNAKQAQRLELEVPAGLLRDGENALEVANVGDTGARYSMVFLDGFTLQYPRRLEADDGRLIGRWSQSGAGAVSGVGQEVAVVDTTDAVPRWLARTSVQDGSVLFHAESERSYTVESAPHRAQVIRPLPSSLRSVGRQSDYLVIGPLEFRLAVEPLLEHRATQGLNVAFVAVEEIFSEFGYGERTPESIRAFLSYAYGYWRKPAPRYVVLLGDGTYDYEDAFQQGESHNRVPPMMVKTRFLWTASDPAYASVRGDDLLPDLAIGRLAAASVSDVEVMVEKILRYERGEPGLEGEILLVADNADGAGSFQRDARELVNGVLAGRDVTEVYLGHLGTTETRIRIRDGFDRGARLVSYVGHGGIHLWADENIFNTTAVDELVEQPSQPLLLTMNCLNGYFHFPFFDSLGEALVKAEGKGAIAAFSPSGLSLHEAAQRYHEALLHELLHGGHERLGDAVLAAQTAYIETGALPDLITIYHLLGDPALLSPGPRRQGVSDSK